MEMNTDQQVSSHFLRAGLKKAAEAWILEELLDINIKGNHNLIEEKFNYPQLKYVGSSFSLVKIPSCVYITGLLRTAKASQNGK